MNQHIVNQSLPRSDFSFQVINLDFSSSFEEMHGGIFRKALVALRLLWRLAHNLLIFRPNIVYFTAAPFGVALFRDFLFTIVCRLFRKEIYFHLHGTGLAKKNSVFYRLVYSYMFRKGFLILMSETLYPDVSQYIERERCRILPNAVVGPDQYKPHENNAGTLNILHMANLHPGKGFMTVLRVFASLVDEGLDVY
ncbi:MAG: hypothetical protein KJO81_12725, partial [Gammaproteobacteria bacterium]|nr:hypothetical protein [Gammaproteobacteria bacterium]